MLTTAAREIAAAIHASQRDRRAVVKRRQPRHHRMAAGRPRAGRLRRRWPRALDAVRHQLAASVARAARRRGRLAARRPARRDRLIRHRGGIPGGAPVGADVRELFSILTSHLGQVLAKARDYEQARAVALTLQHAILAPTELPHGFAARYTPAVPPLEVGGDWYDVVPLPGQRTGVVVGDCVGRGLPAAASWASSAPPARPSCSAPAARPRP